MPDLTEQLDTAIASLQQTVAAQAGQIAALAARVTALEGRPPATSGSRVPTVPPVITPAPPPRITWKIAAKKPSGDGLVITQPGTYRGLGWDGYNQNVIVRCDGEVVFEDCAFVNAFRDDGTGVYVGQGLYVERAKSVVAVRSIFAYNGHREGANARNRNGYRHGWYQNVNGGFAQAIDCLFAGNSACGLQTRTASETLRCLFAGNAIGLCHVKGPHRSLDCVWYDGARYAETDEAGEIKAWTSNTAIQSYDALTLTNAKIRGKVGQDAPQAPKSYDMGAVNLATNHRDNPGVTGSLAATGCSIAGWPGPAFSGARVHDGFGFEAISAARSDADWRPVVQDVIAGTLSVVDAIARIRTAVA